MLHHQEIWKDLPPPPPPASLVDPRQPRQTRAPMKFKPPLGFKDRSKTIETDKDWQRDAQSVELLGFPQDVPWSSF